MDLTSRGEVIKRGASSSLKSGTSSKASKTNGERRENAGKSTWKRSGICARHLEKGKEMKRFGSIKPIYIYIYIRYFRIYISTNEMRSLRTVHSYSGKKLSKRKSEIWTDIFFFFRLILIKSLFITRAFHSAKMQTGRGDFWPLIDRHSPPFFLFSKIVRVISEFN